MPATENKEWARYKTIKLINYSCEGHSCKKRDMIELHLGHYWVNRMICLKCDLKKAEKEGIGKKECMIGRSKGANHIKY